MVMLLLAACGPKSEPAPAPVAPVEPTVTATEALTVGSCALCHSATPGVAEAAMTDSCHTCHVWIKDMSSDPTSRAKAIEIFPLWERYERNVATYMEVPDLQAAMARLDPDWVRDYLLDPHDLRPHLNESMPRFGMTPGQIEAIVVAFDEANVVVAQTPAPDPANINAGAQLFVERGCTACHTFGALHTGGIPMSPDLAHTRERMQPDMVAAWIQDPAGVSASATMPAMGVSPEEAIALRDYVMLAEPGWSPAPAPPQTVEPIADATWEQVEAEVFGKICAHCHMNPEMNDGRAGPGNAGGFGWQPTGIELQTCEGVASVADKIPDSLARRRDEVQRDHVQPGQQPPSVDRPDRPGMPLGLPALDDHQTALVLGWIEAGAPCPPEQPTR
jgi:mono/diheme cytochrome c family protein